MTASASSDTLVSSGGRKNPGWSCITPFEQVAPVGGHETHALPRENWESEHLTQNAPTFWDPGKHSSRVTIKESGEFGSEMLPRPHATRIS